MSAQSSAGLRVRIAPVSELLGAGRYTRGDVAGLRRAAAVQHQAVARQAALTRREIAALAKMEEGMAELEQADREIAAIDREIAALDCGNPVTEAASAPDSAGMPGRVLRALASLGGEAYTMEICEAVNKAGGRALAPQHAYTVLNRLAKAAPPRVTAIGQAVQRGRVRRWRLLPEPDATP